MYTMHNMIDNNPACGNALLVDGRPVQRQFRGERYSVFRLRHRLGIAFTFAALGVISLPTVSDAWSNSPISAEVSTTSSYGEAVTADNNGNTFQAVVYKGSISFGSHTVNAATPTTYAYAIVKFNSEGVAQWVANAGSGIGNISGMAADDYGNLYITGWFSGSITFGSTTLTSVGASDVLLVKLNNSGAWVWAKSFGGTGEAKGGGVDTDAAGNVYINGTFRSLTINSTVLTSVGLDDLFVMKLDSSGNFLWVSKVGGIGNEYIQPTGNNLAVDSEGNSYVVGEAGVDPVTVNGTTLTGSGGADLLITKFDSSGAAIWGARAGSALSDQLNGVVIDAQGNAFITGLVRGTATFGSTTLTSYGARDGFIARINSAGVWQWATSFGSAGNEYVYGVAIDQEGGPAIVGSFTSTFTLGATTLTSSGRDDGFVAKWNSSGAFQWVKTAGGTGADEFSGVGISSDGNILVSGYFSGSSTVNIGGGSLTIGAVDLVNVFWGLSSSGSALTTTTTTTVAATTTTVAPTTTTVAPTTTTTTTVAPPAVAVVTALPLADTPLVANKPLSAGGEISVTFGGFVPGEFVQLIVASTPRVIGSGYADSKGVVTLTGNMPSSLASGKHTLAVYAPVSGTGFKQPITVTRVTVMVKNSYTARTLAKRVGVKIVSPNAKVTMRVASSSKKICAIVAAKLKTLKTGNCVVTFTVQESKLANGKQPMASKSVMTLIVR